MDDEKSPQFFINKKISQLVKLINHLEDINADREHNISTINNEFDEFFNKSLKNYMLSMKNIYDRCELIDVNINNLVKNEYINELQKFNFDYSNNQIDSNEKIAEMSSKIEYTSASHLKVIHSINEDINLFSQEIIAFGDQQIKNIDSQAKKLREKYRKETDDIDFELSTKIKNFEQESVKKFSELEQNYKNSIKILQASNDNSNSSSSSESLINLKNRLIQIKSEINEIKDKIQFELQIQDLKRLFKQEIDELTTKLENDLLIAKKQGKLMINTVLDTHRNEIFVKNNEIARIYDLKLDEIRKENQKCDYKDEINSFYEMKLKELEKELNEHETISSLNSSSSLLVSNNADEIQKLNIEFEKLNELKNKKIEMINFERNEVNKSFTNQKENVISRHDKKIKEIQDFLSIKSNELNIRFEKLKSELHSQLSKFDASIEKLQNLLEKEKKSCNLNPIEINEAFDRDEKELKAVILKIKNDSELMVENANKVHENNKKIINQQVNEINQKINKFKKSIHAKSTQKLSLIDQSSINANSKCIEIQEQFEKNIVLIMQSHSDKISKLQIDHKEKINNLYDQISIQKESNKIEIINIEKNKEEVPFNLNKQLELFEKAMIDDIRNHKAKNEHKINELNNIIEDLKKRNLLLKDSCNPSKMRNEDDLIIQKLENKLFIVEQHIKDLTLDLANCKKKIVSQEGTYNTQFGTTPTVAVLRPKTGYGQMNTKGSLRPNTTFAINRSKSLLKSTPNKPIVHF